MQAATIAQPETVPLAVTQPTRILVVDDDVDQIASLRLRLEKQGYEVTTAQTCEEALAVAERLLPQLILLDVHLPDGSGLDVCEKLVDSPKTCGIPVLILSGVDRPDIVRVTRTAGCRYFVRKPYDPNALLTLIQTALQQETW